MKRVTAHDGVDAYRVGTHAVTQRRLEALAREGKTFAAVAVLIVSIVVLRRKDLVGTIGESTHGEEAQLIGLTDKGEGTLTERTVVDVCGGISPYDEPFDRLEGQGIDDPTSQLHRVDLPTCGDEVAEALKWVVLVVVYDDIIEVEAVGCIRAQGVGEYDGDVPPVGRDTCCLTLGWGYDDLIRLARELDVLIEGQGKVARIDPRSLHCR